MITNVLATLIVMVTTNVYAPKQYKNTMWITTYPAQVEETWQDVPVPEWGGGIWGSNPTRDNPDVQIVEVREIRKWRFNLEGVPDHVISDKLLKKIERRRTVKMEETWTEKELDLPIDWRTITAATNVVQFNTLGATNHVH
jgi:hypothetical protein